MRAPQLLLALFALGLLTVGAWFLTSERRAEPDPPALTEAGTEAPAAPALSPGQLPATDAEVGLEAAQSTAGRTAAEADPEPAAAPVEEPERGLVGRVVDEFGNPVVEARVFVANSSAFGGAAIDRWAGTERSFMTIEQTETDREGRFRVATGMRGDLRFAVRSPGFAPLRTPRKVDGPDLVELEDFVLERSVVLSGHVVDQAGNGIGGVAIDAVAPSSGSGLMVTFMSDSEDPLAVSGPGGAFEVNELGAGPYRLNLTHEDHPSLVVDGSVPRPGQSESGLRLVMEDGHRISGSVLGLEPGQSGQFKVRARPLRGGDFDPELGMIPPRLADLAADGAFELRGLREGEYRLHAVKSLEEYPVFGSGASAATLASTGDRGVQIQLREPTGLTLRVLDAETGQPIEDFTVEAGLFWLQSLRGEDGEVLEHFPGGVASFPELPVDQGESRTRVKVEADGYESFVKADIELAPGEVVDLGTIRLASVPMVTVRVVEASSGEPVKGARVELQERDPAPAPGERRLSMSVVGGDLALAGGRDSSSARTDEQGVAVLSSLPGKFAQLSVRHRGFAEYRSEPRLLPETGGQEFEVRLSPGGAVTVLVLDAGGEPKKGVRVRQKLVGAEEGPLVIGMGSGSRSSDSEGIVEFDHLLPGTHNFSIQGGGPGGMVLDGGTQIVMAGFGAGGGDEGVDVAVTEGSHTEITLRTRAEGRVVGEVTERGEPLVGATLTFEEVAGGGASEVARMMPSFGGGGPSGRTDSEGAFSVEGLKVGDYEVRIDHPSRVMTSTFELSVREGENRESWDLPLAILEGRVVDSEGEPAVGVRVKPKRYEEPGAPRGLVVASLVVADGGGGAMSFTSGGAAAQRVETDEDGRYLLRGVEPDVDLVVEVTSERFQKAESAPVTCGPDQTRRDVDVEVFEAGSVEAVVRNADGTPAGFCLVELDYLDEAEPMPDPERGFVGDTGQTRLDSLRPGRWRASARSVGMLPETGPGGEEPPRTETVEFEVVAGEVTGITLRFP